MDGSCDAYSYGAMEDENWYCPLEKGEITNCEDCFYYSQEASEFQDWLQAGG